MESKADKYREPPYEPLRDVRVPEAIPEQGVEEGEYAVIYSVFPQADGSLVVLAEISGPDRPVAMAWVDLEVTPDGEVRLLQ